MRIILDTNVFVSGIFWEGNFCSQIIEKWKEKRFDLVSSIEIVDELVKTLLDFKIQMPKEMIKGWQKLIIENSAIVEPTIKIDFIKEDPNDNKFLEAAITGNADLIISQDKHLLKLKEYEGIRILKPEEVLSLL